MEGSQITEYQLLKLRPRSDSREFRTVTGGILHVSGGATRDTLDFNSSHIAKRTYAIHLPTLPVGEYGLLSPAASSASSAAAQLGKMYTFTIGGTTAPQQTTAFRQTTASQHKKSWLSSSGPF